MSDLTVRQRLEDWAAEIEKAIGMRITLSAEGVCSFYTADGLMMTVEAPPNVPLLVFYAVVGQLDDLNDARMLRALLACNWFGSRTAPGVLGLNPAGNELMLCYTWLEAQTATAEQFAATLTGITQVAEALREQITQRTVLEILPNTDATDAEKGAKPDFSHLTMRV
jgi:hypothetical protein